MSNSTWMENLDDFTDLFNVAEGGLSNIPAYIIVYIVLFACASLIGTVGNALVIITMFVNKKLRHSRNAFIVSLAFADFMVSCITMPASISGVVLGKQFYKQRSTLCAFTSLVCAPGCVASMHSIAWIAISRYYYIGKYNVYTRFFSPNRIAIYIFSIWLMSFIVHLPNHFGWGETRYSFMLRYCTFDTDFYSYTLFYSSVLLLAIVVAFVFYFKIYLVLRKSTLSKTMIIGHKQDDSHSTSVLADEVKIIKTSFKIFILFLITWSPLCLLFLIHLMEKVPPWLYLYAALAAHGNSTLNFIVYFLENDMFRKAMKEIIYKILKKHNQVNAFSRRASRVPTLSEHPSIVPDIQLA